MKPALAESVCFIKLEMAAVDDILHDMNHLCEAEVVLVSDWVGCLLGNS